MECGGGNRNSYLLPPGRRPLERRWDRHTRGTRRRIGEDNSSGGPAGRSVGSSCTVRSAGEAPQVQSRARREFAWLDPLHPRKMDQEYDIRPRLRPIDTSKLKLKPSEYYQRQMYATFQEDHVGLKLLEELGEDTVLWASDYPHGDSVWPDSHQIVDKDMAGMDQAVVRKITRDNARRLYLGH